MQVATIAIALLILLCFAGIAFHLITGTTVRDALRRLAGTSVCRAIGHRRHRATVRKVGTTYSGRCRVCGTRLSREGREGPWQVSGLTGAAGGAEPN